MSAVLRMVNWIGAIVNFIFTELKFLYFINYAFEVPLAAYLGIIFGIE